MCSFPTTPSGRSVQAKAFDLALSELSRVITHPENNERLVDTVMASIEALLKAGQTDPDALARYAVGRAVAAYRARHMAN